MCDINRSDGPSWSERNHYDREDDEPEYVQHPLETRTAKIIACIVVIIVVMMIVAPIALVAVNR